MVGGRIGPLPAGKPIRSQDPQHLVAQEDGFGFGLLTLADVPKSGLGAGPRAGAA